MKNSEHLYQGTIFNIMAVKNTAVSAVILSCRDWREMSSFPPPSKSIKKRLWRVVISKSISLTTVPVSRWYLWWEWTTLLPFLLYLFLKGKCYISYHAWKFLNEESPPRDFQFFTIKLTFYVYACIHYQRYSIWFKIIADNRRKRWKSTGY